MTIFNDDYEQYALEPIYSTKKITTPYQEALLKRNSAIELTQPPHELTQAQSGFPFTRITDRSDLIAYLCERAKFVDMCREVGE